jgi:hypothetical protein
LGGDSRTEGKPLNIEVDPAILQTFRLEAGTAPAK